MRQARVVAVGSDRAQEMLRSIGSAIEAAGTNLSFHVGSPAELRSTEVWQRADLLLAADTRCTRADIVAAPRLRAIVTPVLGVDGFDAIAATELGVLIVNGRVAENYESMAESTIMLALACLYDLPGQQHKLRQGIAPMGVDPRCRMLKGRTVGIIGFGNIAQAVVQRLQGWDVNVLVHSRHELASAAQFVQVSLAQLLGQSDVVLVLCSLNEESRHLLNAETLGQAKPGAVIVNTARGGIIDEAALVELTRQGRFSYVALDVFEREPLPLDSPLRELPNTILTPHAIGHTIDALAAMRERTIANVLEVLQGRAPSSVRNPEALQRWQQRWDRQRLI